MRAWKFGDDVNTDLITPGRYNMTTDEAQLGKIAFIEYRPEFTKTIQKGDIIVAGSNFGCGSSREHAPIAIKAAGIKAVVAKSFARIFYRNCINIGLPILICKETDKIEDGDQVEVELTTSVIMDATKGITIQANPLPEFVQRIVSRGGLINFLREDGYV